MGAAATVDSGDGGGSEGVIGVEFEERDWLLGHVEVFDCRRCGALYKASLHCVWALEWISSEPSSHATLIEHLQRAETKIWELLQRWPHDSDTTPSFSTTERAKRKGEASDSTVAASDPHVPSLPASRQLPPSSLSLSLWG